MGAFQFSYSILGLLF